MKRTLCFLAVILTSIISSQAIAERKEIKYPNALNKLYIDTNKIDEYNRLAQPIGFEFGEQYSYTEFANIKRENKIGTAGNYEWLLLSTGGNENDFVAIDRYNREKCGWKMIYYSNHDITMIYETCHNESRSNTFIRILKLCKGRNPNLHLN